MFILLVDQELVGDRLAGISLEAILLTA